MIGKVKFAGIDVMMPTWAPNFEEIPRGPLYWRIAAALARDIQAGRLAPGERLPTHRDLAHNLGITVNTASKAYAEAERNGSVASRTGRGTYVKDFPEKVANDAAMPQDIINLSASTVSSEAFGPVFNQLLAGLSRRTSLHGLLEHQPHPGLDRHRAAGARWIAKRGLEANPDQVIVCNGAQEGMLAALLAFKSPHATILTEKLNYTGVRYNADILNLNLRGVEIDEYGLVPEALEAACKQEKIAAILVSPTNHNPTNSYAPLERRRAIVEVAGRAGALLIEDDTLGHISGHDVPPIAALAPDRCIYVCGMSKSMVAGLRIGYMLVPVALVNMLVDSLNKIHWNSPTLMGEIATLLIEAGHADKFVAWHRQEARERYKLACEVLGRDGGPDVSSYHLWLSLPEPWRTTDFAAELKLRGVLVAPANKFAVDRGPVPHAVRLSLGWMHDRASLEQGLRIVADCMASHPH